MRTDCERRWEIDALREGSLGTRDAEAFERHARACDVCAALIARDAKLRVLASALAPIEPDDLEVRRMRARVLHGVATGEPTRRVAAAQLAVALALFLLAAVSFAMLRHPSHAPLAAAPPASAPASAPTIAMAGTVLRADGARWSQAREGLTERVRLEDGALRLHVRHQTGDERFLVDLPDGELEVRGTTFEVSARGGATEHVSVDEGVVAVRLRGFAAELVLRAGDAWSAPHAELAKPLRVAAIDAFAASRPPRKSEARPSSANAGADDGADGYAAAIALMQGERFSRAATAFHAFLLAHPAASQAEDASFLEAAALARGGRPDAAALAAEDHLARFPRSFHRKEAAILIARAARDRGDCAQARAVLAPWLGSAPDDDALAALKKCTGE